MGSVTISPKDGYGILGGIAADFKISLHVKLFRNPVNLREIFAHIHLKKSVGVNKVSDPSCRVTTCYLLNILKVS